MLDKCMGVSRRVSRQFCTRNPFLEYKEVESEAFFIMVQAMQSWDMTKGRTIKSWVGYIVYRELCRKFKPDPLLYTEMIDSFASDSFDVEDVCVSRSIFSEVSETSKKALKLLFSDHLETKDDNKNTIKNAIKKKLEKMGANQSQIRKSFHELKMIAR